MLKKYYQIGSGLCGKKIDVKTSVLILVILYCLTLSYIGLFYEINWIGGMYPSRILFGGYRDIAPTTFASIVSFLFIFMYLVEIYWLNIQSNTFFNKITIDILQANETSGRKIYFSFLIKRCLDLFLINISAVLPVFFLFLVKDGAYPIFLITHSFLLFYGSVFLVLLYDLFHYLTQKPSAASVLTILTLILSPLISIGFRPLIVNYSTNGFGVKFLHFFPDVFSIAYQYVLYAFGSTYSLTKICYPLFLLTICLCGMIYISKNIVTRFSA